MLGFKELRGCEGGVGDVGDERGIAGYENRQAIGHSDGVGGPREAHLLSIVDGGGEHLDDLPWRDTPWEVRLSGQVGVVEVEAVLVLSGGGVVDVTIAGGEGDARLVPAHRWRRIE